MNIDVRYLDIKWSDEHTVLKIDYSQNSLSIESHKDHSSLESITFKKYQPRLGIRILDKNVLHAPFFVISDTNTKELLPVVDPTTHETWWIESSSWDNSKKLHHSEIYRTVGSVSIKVQNKTLKVINNSLEFTVNELEDYLRDFKNDLWMLILNEQSYVKGAIEKESPNIFHPEMINSLHDYADAVARIVKKPTNELKEIQVERPKRSVKPVNRTFMELAVKGNPKFLTSRASYESYDTPDNRYIHHTLKRVLYLINQLAVLGSSQDSIYGRIIASEQQRLNTLSNSKTVDPVVFQNEMKAIEEKIEKIKKVGLKLSKEMVTAGQTQTSAVENIYQIRLGKQYGPDKSRGYFCSHLDGYHFKNKLKTYLVVWFPLLLPEDILDNLSGDKEFKVKGVVKKSEQQNTKGLKFWSLEFLTISKIKIMDTRLTSALARKTKEKYRLEKLGWVVPYTDKEKQEIELERNFINKKIELLSVRQDEVQHFNSSIISTVKTLRRSKLFFEQSGIKISANFPNTMVFVQNPSYSMAKTSFSKISNINGMDDSIFKAMMSIDEIGLVNISNLYEKWCLLQIIKVLAEVYSFKISGNWQHDLINAVSNKEYNIKFEFVSESLGRSIILTYECQLEPDNPGSKRPDYVIDLYKNGQDKRFSRLVLDAKFKDTLGDDALASLIHELYSEKDYSEGEKNQVFILHASGSAINNRTSPLGWGVHSDYGHMNLHRSGGVYLSPSHKHGRSIDNLQRLIGLFLQPYNYYDPQEDSDSANIEPGISELKHHHLTFCIACGNSDRDRLNVTKQWTKSWNVKWMLKCADCHHIQVESFCRSCQCKLHKNGYYWTYHKTQAVDPFNIVCPNCEDYFDPTSQL